MTYSPGVLQPKYHRRCRVSLPCSEWERVVPQRYGHRTTKSQQARLSRIPCPSPRPISTGQLNTLLRLHFRPINLVFCQGPYRVIPVGDLILGWASHLDAFSAYPVRT